MTYVFYADVFWMNQFLLHTAILLLTERLHGRADRLWGRCFASSAIGSTCSTAVLLLSRSYYLYLAMALLVTLPLMTRLAFGKSDAAVFRKRYAGCFAMTILLGGLVTALENIAGIAQIPFLSALIAFLLAEHLVRLSMRRRQIAHLLYPVLLRHGERKVQINGLLDTGNLLREPCSGRPVHLLNASILESCGITEADFLGFVPYQALGSSDGLLAIYRADELIINLSDTGSDIRPAIIAAAPDELFYGKEYDAILNSAIITEAGISDASTSFSHPLHAYMQTCSPIIEGGSI